MNKTLRRAVAATTLALTAAFAAVSGTALAAGPAAEPMWPAVTTDPQTNQLAIAVTSAQACTSDGYGVATAARIQVSLSDIVKAGQTVDAEGLDAGLMLAQLSEDDTELKAELAKYDFSKADPAKISKIFKEEWATVAQKYSSEQFGRLTQEMQQDILTTLETVARKYEGQTGVTIALEFASGAMSPAPIPECQVKPALAPSLKP